MKKYFNKAKKLRSKGMVWVYLSLLCLFCLQLQAFHNQPNLQEIDLYIFEDASALRSFQQIRGLSIDMVFKKLENNSLRFDLSKSAIWLKFKKESPSDCELYYLELSTSNLHHVTFFNPIGNDQYELNETGFLEPFHNRPINTDRLTFPVVANGEWYYLKIETSHFLNTEVELKKLPALVDSSNKRTLFYGIYSGIMVIMVIAVILFIIQGKEYRYIFYAGYILFISTINLTEKGFYFQFLWPDNANLNYYFPLLPFGVSICLLLFLKTTFGIDQYNKIIYWLSLWIVTIAIFLPVIIFLALHRYQHAVILTQIHSMLICLLVLIMNIIAYSKNKENRPFLKLIIVGLCFFCSGVITYLLSQNEILPINFLTENAIIFGSALEVSFFTASISLYQSSITIKYRNLIVHQNEELQAGIDLRTIELKQKNEQLCNSLEEKDNILYVVAHDLKSPLNQTKALSHLISVIAKDIPLEARDMLQRIQTTSENGLRLIQELGTVSRLESENEEVELIQMDLYESLESTFKNYATLASHKSIALEIQEVASCKVKTHAPYLIRIMENLLSNAIKFSSKGTQVVVKIEQNEQCEISIQDQGPGFSQQDIKRMGKKFQRLSAVPTAGEHSTGLGLYITKLLAEKISAQITLESSTSRGSLFRIRFQ